MNELTFVVLLFLLAFAAFCTGLGIGVSKVDPADPSKAEPVETETYTVECFSGGVRIWSTDQARNIFQRNGYVEVTTEEGKTYSQADCVVHWPAKK